MSAPRACLALLLLLAPATSGCGAMIIQHGDVPQVEWPPTVTTPLAERPTALVRLVSPHVDGDDHTNTADDLMAAFRAPFSSGLFSSVSYQLGTDHIASRADVVLDISVSEADAPLRWYAVVGCATLGTLPIALTEEHSARIVVRDGDGVLLGEVEAKNRQTMLLWLPLSALNLSLGLVDPAGIGDDLGLKVYAFPALERQLTENLVRVALLRAHERFGFRRPAPPLPRGEAASRSG